MATAYAVNSRLLRGFCASGPKSIAHKRSFGKSPAPAEGRFPGVFSRSGQGRSVRHGRGMKMRAFRCGQPTADKGRAPAGTAGRTSTARGAAIRPKSRWREHSRCSRPYRPTPVKPTEKRMRSRSYPVSRPAPRPGAGCQRRADRLQCGHVCKNRPPARGSTGLHAGPGRKP